MQLSKDKRTGNYRASFRTANGKRRSLTTRTSDRKEAVQIVKESGLEQLEMAARVGRLTNEAISLITTDQKITMMQAVDLWVDRLRTKGRSENTIAQSRQVMQAFTARSSTANQAPATITYDEINAWVNERSPVKAGSRSVMLSICRSFFRFAFSNGWATGNPAQDVEVNLGALNFSQKEAVQRAAFTELEIGALIAATLPGAFWRAAIPIGRWTGLRLSDIAGLEWASLQMPGRILVWTQKRDKRVDLPLEPDELKLAIADIAYTNPVYCFPEQREIVNDPARRSLLSVQFGRLCEQCGIEGKSFHCLRHHRATYLATAGVPIDDISKALGHGSKETTNGYIHT